MMGVVGGFFNFSYLVFKNLFLDSWKASSEVSCRKWFPGFVFWGRFSQIFFGFWFYFVSFLFSYFFFLHLKLFCRSNSWKCCGIKERTVVITNICLLRRC